MKNRKTRTMLAVASALAGVAAYMLLTVHVTVISPLPATKGAQAVYVGPNGATEAPFLAFGKPVTNPAAVTYTLHIDTNKPYAGTPDLIAVEVASGAPVSVAVPSGIEVKPVAPITSNNISYGNNNVTVDTTTFKHETTRIAVRQDQWGQWALIAKTPGTYHLTVRVGDKTLAVPLTVVPAPSVAVATRTTYSAPLVGASMSIPLGKTLPQGAHLTWTMTGDVNGKMLLKTVPDITTAGYQTHLTTRGPIYGTVVQTMREVGVSDAMIVAGYDPTWNQPSEFATVTALEAVDPVHRNPLWLILGAGLALLALVAPGRRSRGNDGDGQDGGNA